MNDPGSRYENADEREIELPSTGQTVRYLSPRILPPTSATLVTTEHRMRPAERLDVTAYAAFGDPDAWWRIADAHVVADPRELETEGVTVRLGTAQPRGGGE